MDSTPNHVAVITGAARGQGRSHAVALAATGVDIIAIDRCADIDSIPYPLATPADLEETAALVREAGGRNETVVADVRNLADLQAGIDRGIDAFGDVDIVIANAGVVGMGLTDPADDQVYRDIVDTNLVGVWHTIAATAPSMIRRGTGGSMVLISSMQGLIGRGGRWIRSDLRLRRIEARRRRTDAIGSECVCPAQHPGELDPSDRRRHAHDLQRAHGPDVRGEPRGQRDGGQPAACSLRRTVRRHQRSSLPDQ
jgi:NAD(P)-dependent dehydrogenase (short-subunit alcohol dehydrogenase family)